VESAAAVEETAALVEGSFPARAGPRPAVIRAYSAALEGLRGKHAAGLLDKVIHVQRAISLFRGLREENPGSMEILFLRFSFFHQIPPIFGVRSFVAPDLEGLVRMLEERRYEEVPPAIQRDMAAYITECGEANADQLARLRRLARREAPS
jgi:hypothetical protein